MIIRSLENLSLISKQIVNKTSKEDCIFLYGEIGTGKTTFTRYFINHFQRKEKIQETEVLSPTFNLVYEYEIKTLKIMHYDLYRLKTTKETKQLGIFEDTKKTIKIIEWPELIKNKVKDKLEINLKYTEDENERNINFLGYGKWRNFKIDGILYGDLIYDSYLREKFKYTINLNDKDFIKFFYKSIDYYFYCKGLFERYDIKAVILSHTVYIPAILGRIALSSRFFSSRKSFTITEILAARLLKGGIRSLVSLKQSNRPWCN